MSEAGQQPHTTTYDVRRMRRAHRRRRLVVLLGALALAALAWTAFRLVRGGPEPVALAPAQQVRLAFAGDVHAEGSAGSALTQGLGTGAAPLADADLAVVNLETAVTTRGTPVPGKQYVFRAPAGLLTALKAGGVDAVNLANNHGMDYGQVGLADTLAAARAVDLPLIGAGVDDTAALTPLRRTVRGVRVSVLAATDVLDSSVQRAWTAGPGAPGLASAKEGTALLDAVTAERPRSDVLVVFLHWGREQSVCPTDRQRELARALAAAGADVVVGSHAHVVQPQDVVGSTTVVTRRGAAPAAPGEALTSTVMTPERVPWSPVA